MKTKKLNRVSVILGVSLLACAGAPAAKADGVGGMAAFYLATKGIQVTALSGTADMWRALGAADKAQQTLGLAQDLEKGDLGGEAGMKAMRVASGEMRDTMLELQAVGAPLTKEQKAAANAAYLKIAGTTVLWAGAVIAAKSAVDSQDNALAKIAVGVLMAKESSDAVAATRDLLGAWKAYRQFNKGTQGFREPSKEILATNQMLASL